MHRSLLAEDPDAIVAPYLMSGGTDAKHFRKLGMRSYGFAPLRLPADLDFTALFHGVDERVPTDALEFGVRVMDRFLGRRLLANPETEGGPAPDLLDVLEVQRDARERRRVEEPRPAAEQHRHHVHLEHVDQPRHQQLSDHVRAADHGHVAVTRGRQRLGRRRLHALGHEGERQRVVLLRRR